MHIPCSVDAIYVWMYYAAPVVKLSFLTHCLIMLSEIWYQLHYIGKQIGSAYLCIVCAEGHCLHKTGSN